MTNRYCFLQLITMSVVGHMAAGRSQMDLVVNGKSVQHLVKAHIGARPGIDATFLLYPQGLTTVSAYAPQQSQYRQNNSDLLYIRDDIARVPFVETGAFVLGGDALAAFNTPWGVCDNVLYLGVMPRKCYKGTFVQIMCTITDCPVSFVNTQHIVTACTDPVMLGSDFVVLHDGCSKRMTVINSDLPTAIEYPAGTAQASLWQMGATVQYNPETFEMSLWIRDTNAGRVESIVTTTILIIFLSIWLTWTRDLNSAIFNQSPTILETTWTQVAVGGMLAFDAVTFSGSIKVWYLFTDADVFTPPTVDWTYGNSFSEWYCQGFVIIALGLVSVAAVILAIMSATIGDWMPQFILSWLHPGMWFVNGDPTKAKSNMPREKIVLIVLLRWVVELIVLTALHIAIPTHLGPSYRAAVGLGIGISLALIAGRDVYILLHETLKSGRLLQQSSTIVLALFCLAYTVTHVSIFMVLPTFASAETLTPIMCVACSWSLTIQATCMGVVLCRQSYAAGRATHVLM
jgi:hypothetical protein